jgi:hypothetical protein
MVTGNQTDMLGRTNLGQKTSGRLELGVETNIYEIAGTRDMIWMLRMDIGNHTRQ